MASWKQSEYVEGRVEEEIRRPEAEVSFHQLPIEGLQIVFKGIANLPRIPEVVGVGHQHHADHQSHREAESHLPERKHPRSTVSPASHFIGRDSEKTNHMNRCHEAAECRSSILSSS